MAGKIYKAITAIMRQVGAIGKDAKNESQKYQYRSAEAVYNRVQPLMATHGVFSVPKVLEESHETGQSKGGGPMHWARLRVQYTFFADDGSSIEVVVSAEGMDSGDKATAKAMTQAHRYAICQLLNIPYAVVDPESGSPEWATGLNNKITLKDLNELKSAWLAAHGKPDQTKADLAAAFSEWVSVTCETTFEVGDWRQWTNEELQKCQEALE